MNRFSQLSIISLLFAPLLSIGACNGGNQGGGGTSQNPTSPTVAVTPASSSITTAQNLSVTIVVSGTSGTPTGSVVLSSGTYASSATTLSSGSATITIPSGSLAAGSATLTARYTPDSASSTTYSSALGTASMTVTQPVTTPTVSVTPASNTITIAQNLGVTIAVSGTSGTPTGSVVLSSGSYASSAATLSSGSATITIPAGSLSAGTDTLTAKYTPDSNSSATYNSATGTGSVAATSGAATAVNVSIDALANRHAISPFVYGGNPSEGPAEATDLGMSLARFGGNEASNYNWQLHTYNAGGDWYFEDFNLGDFQGNPVDSVQFITNYQNAGSHALTTMPMLSWVAQSAENGTNGHWSYSVKTLGAQCSVDPNNTDAGNGVMAGGTPASCSTSVPVTTQAVTTAYYPLLDSTANTCSTGNCVYREPWAQALAAAFTGNACPVPYSPIASCHFYDMDNEPDSWPGSHKDVHPSGTGYDELANLFEAEATALKSWDPAAVRFGPVVSSWWFYWNASNSTTDSKSTHASIDFLPWWLNQIYWLDQISGARTLDVFDVHGYPDAVTTGLSNAQLQALAASIYRDYWDPTYDNGADDAPWATTMEPNYGKPFRIPRLKALVNAIYPGTPLAFTEWSGAFYQESDFSTALGDADAYGIFGREGISFATRWGSPTTNSTTTKVPNPNYLALKLYGNYDSAHDGFGTVSISDTNSGNPNLFSSYAALNPTGTVMTIMVLNKDPNNAVQTTFNLNGFNPTSYVAYSISSTASHAISVSNSQAWSSSQTFAPYSITLLVVSGTESSKPASEWYLNPDDLMIPASGTATLSPAITSGTSKVTLTSAVFDSYEGAPACSGTLALTNATITTTQPATITVNAGGTPGFCHFTVTGSDSAATQTKGGWMIVGNPPATLTQSGNKQSGSAGTALSQPLTVTLAPGQSGGSANGAGILFTSSAGTLSNGTTTGTSVIAVTNSSGVASVTLTLPSSKGPVTVTAQDQFALGGASVTFIETAQ